MFASLVTTPTRQQGAGENWKPSTQPVQKAENSCVFTTAEIQRWKGFFFSSATHTAPAISITAMWSQREQYICQQDQVLNRPRKPLNPSRHPLHRPQQSLKTPQPGHVGQIHSGYPPVFYKEDTSITCRTCPNYLGSCLLPFRRPGQKLVTCFWAYFAQFCTPKMSVLATLFSVGRTRTWKNKNSLTLIKTPVIMAQLWTLHKH